MEQKFQGSYLCASIMQITAIGQKFVSIFRSFSNVVGYPFGPIIIVLKPQFMIARNDNFKGMRKTAQLFIKFVHFIFGASVCKIATMN